MVPNEGRLRKGSRTVSADRKDALPPTRSLTRALSVLEALVDVDAAGVSDVAETTGLPVPTTYRLLRTLASRGYVIQDLETRHYRLGAVLIRLGRQAERRWGPAVERQLARLVEVSGETANLATLEGDFVIYVAQVPSPHHVRMFTEVGRRVLPHATAVGKVLLASWEEARIRDLVERTGLPPYTPATIVTVSGFLEQLARVRSQGYAEDFGEREVDVRCIAVPVGPLGPDCLAALSVSGPSGRLDDDLRMQLLPELRAIAKELSRALTTKPR